MERESVKKPVVDTSAARVGPVRSGQRPVDPDYDGVVLPGIAASPLALAGHARVAVIDIGSNSIRLVVYDRLGRLPTPIHNEKILCGLGRDIGRTGRLHPEGVAMALSNLARFTGLVAGMEVAAVDVLATAAVRDAADGPSFIAEVAQRTALRVTVISGEEEARLSGMGVLAGNAGAQGVMGDMGGGSLELVGLVGGGIGEQATLPLGALRLVGTKGWRADASRTIADAMQSVEWLGDYRGATFYPVGGNWRALAKLDMARRNHPIHIIHQYKINGHEMADLAALIARQGKSSLSALRGISRRRLETLPAAALVMKAVLDRLEPKEVVFSAYGLREGHLFDLLPADQQALDPLVSGCEVIARRLGRSGDGDVLWQWTQPLFEDDDGPAFDRMRRAACLLSDICWAEHPDYRAEHAFLSVLRLPIAGLSHAERAFLALSVYIRYGGKATDSLVSAAAGLLSADANGRVNTLGQALRLAHTLSGGAMGLVARTCLQVTPETIVLWLPEGGAALGGDAVQRRLESLGSSLGVLGRLAVSRSDPARPQ